MELALAGVKFPRHVEEAESSDGFGNESDGEGVEGRERKPLAVGGKSKKKSKSGGFQAMGLCQSVLNGIRRKGYRVPTPIQRKCIPLILDGKDVVAMARTGSGKTASFLLPMFEKLRCHCSKVGARCLILSPTRELAAQTLKFARELGKFLDLKSVLVLGGEKIEEQFAALHSNPDIIVATPGRFLHLVVEMDLSLSLVEYVVFDEADQLFELGFAQQLQEIIRRLPECRQTLLFSATLPKLLMEFARAGLREPVLVRLDVDTKLSEQLRTHFVAVRHDDKPAVLLHLLQHTVPPSQQALVFLSTKHHVEYVSELLTAANITNTCAYSSLDPAARKINLAKFINKKVSVMAVTDVAARGMDIPLLDNVINYNFPSKPKLFVHRVGRVARAGRTGCAYSLVSPDESAYLLDLHLFLGRALVCEGENGVFGAVPQAVLDSEQEFLRHTHEMNYELSCLRKVAENGHKQYVRCRPPASPESVRRSKCLPSPLPPHPLFGHTASESSSLLNSLRTYKPSQTILEVHGTSRNSSKRVMQEKRKVHGRLLGGPSQPSQETSVAAKGGKGEHYLPYTPADLHSEKGLSLGKRVSFEQQAAEAVMDLEEDDGTSLQKACGRMKWDRKRKKFVSDTGKDVKKIKTESGAKIPASYKADLYKKWREKNKVEKQPLVEDEGDMCVPKAPGGKPRRWSGVKGACLKSKAQILLKRGKKEQMERNRKAKGRKRPFAQKR